MLDNQPCLLIIAGPNGSGKSTSYEFLKNEDMVAEGTFFINPDVFAQHLAQETGFQNVNNLPDSLKTKIDIMASKIAISLRETALENRRNLAIETTASSKGIIRLISKAKKMGYKVIVEYIVLSDVELNKRRIAIRAQLGGHFVENSLVERRYKRSLELLPLLIAQADHARVIDNSENREVIFEKSPEKIRKIPNERFDEKWLANIERAILVAQKNA